MHCLFLEECTLEVDEIEDHNTPRDDCNTNVCDENDIAIIESCLRLGIKGGVYLPEMKGKLSDERLGSPPEKIDDKQSAILGSGFYTSHRIVTPTKHSYEKIFHIALSETMCS